VTVSDQSVVRYSGKLSVYFINKYLWLQQGFSERRATTRIVWQVKRTRTVLVRYFWEARTYDTRT